MTDLSLPYGEAVSNLQRWRGRYSAKEYPHMIVKNMMYEGYTMRELFREFQNHSLPTFSTIEEAIGYLKSYHDEVSKFRILPRLEQLLADNPEANIGGLIFANYDRMASTAELSPNMLEEIEFSYIFDFLQEKCVQMWMALCLTGQEEIGAIRLLTGQRGPLFNFREGIMINDATQLNFGLVRTIFQDLGVNIFMSSHYQPLPAL